MDAATQLTDIQFTERKRGYDPDEVDSFLEKLGDAVVKLQEKVKEANRRADEAENRAAKAPAADEEQLGETLKKTLVLAQKTADQAVDEAKVEAQRLLDEARSKAEALVRKAEDERKKLVSEAEREAREAAEAAARPVREAITRLTTERDGLSDDVGLLERHLDEVRRRLRAGVDEIRDLLDHPERFRAGEGPRLPERPAAVAGRQAPSGTPGQGSAGPPPRPESAGPGAPTSSPGTDRGADSSGAAPPAAEESSGDKPGSAAGGGAGEGDAPRSKADSKLSPGGGIFPTREPGSPKGPAGSSERGEAAGGSTTLASATGISATAVGAGAAAAAPTTKDAAAESSGSGDDGFLTELKRAVTEESELGPVDPEADEAMKAFFDQDLEDEPKRVRFGRRG